MSHEELLDIAVAGARQAGVSLMKRFREPAKGVGTKSSPTDLVSDADRESEAFLTAYLAEHRPGDGLLGEEGAGKSSTTGLEWVVDPLDGTVNYLYGIPTWGISVSVEDDDGAVVGAIHDPNREETFTAIRGVGAWLNGEPIHVSDRNDLGRALIATGFSYDPEIKSHQAGVVARVLFSVRDVRRSGSAALDLAWLAAGRFDGFYEAHLERWDRSAGVLIAKEAGAVVTDLDPPKGDSTGVIAAGPNLHGQLSRLVTRVAHDPVAEQG